MQREDTWQDRYERSGLRERITSVDLFAINHGFEEWKGQTLPEFIQSEMDRARKEEREKFRRMVVKADMPYMFPATEERFLRDLEEME